MPLRSDWSSDSCPVARSLDVLGDPWVLLIVREAFYGCRRFAEFREALDIADTVLSRRLAGMVQAGLLAKTPYRDGQRTRDEYVLTAAGEDLLPVLNALLLWGHRHADRPGQPAVDIVHRGCGAVTESADRCSSCGAALTPGEVSWRHEGWAQDRPMAGSPR